MKKQLREVMQCVQAELEYNQFARKNDNELILSVMKRLGVDTSASFAEVVGSGNLPTSFESITRARRKVQENNPQLKDSVISVLRQEREEDYRQFVKEN